MIYKEKLRKAISGSGSNLVVGLDADLSKIPDFARNSSMSLLRFNKMVIRATEEFCAGYKINLAFYESCGIEGLRAVEKTLEYIPSGKITICDAKRGDIGNTSEHYAASVFKNMGFDAVTLSPYMGTESISPFLRKKDNFAYILVRTSNKSSGEIQDLRVGNKKVYEIVADIMIDNFGNQAGFVIGAGHTKDVRRFSSDPREIPLLIPGIGAQNNDLKVLVENVKNGLFVINASRSVIFAGNKKMEYTEYYKCVQNAAMFLNSDINKLKSF